MKMKSMMLLAVASGCGLLAMFLFQQAQGGTQSQKEKTVPVLYAIAQVTPGTKLDETNVEFRDVPISLAPDSAVTTAEEYKDRASRVRLFPDDIVTIEKLLKKGEGGASGDIPEGMVAVPIPVDATMMLGGLLLPGNRVDVLVTFESSSQRGNNLGKRIMTVLEFVEVFATDSRREIESGTSESKTQTITLLASRKEALLVKLAEDVGKLHITMRSKDDKNPRLATEAERFNESHHVELFKESGQDDDSKSDVENQRAQQQAAVVAAQTTAAVNAARAIDAAANKAKVEAKPKLKQFWKVEIYSGDTKRVDEFEIPVAANQNSNPLLNSLNSIFSSGSQANPTEEVGVLNDPEPPVSEVAGDQDVERKAITLEPSSSATDDSEPPIPVPLPKKAS